MPPRLTPAEKLIYLLVIIVCLLVFVLALTSPEVFTGNKAVYQNF